MRPADPLRSRLRRSRLGAALGNRTPDLRITRVFSCVARGFKARAGFMFAGCCWRRSLAVDGSSGTSRGHASAAQSSQERLPRPSAHTWLRLSPLETGCTGNTCRVRAGRRVVENRGGEPIDAGSGAAARAWTVSGCLSPWCSPSPGIGASAPSLPQPLTDSGCSCTSRSILEPEAPPEANESRTVSLGS